jgi:hypothetical protein
MALTWQEILDEVPEGYTSTRKLLQKLVHKSAEGPVGQYDMLTAIFTGMYDLEGRVIALEGKLAPK